jgi:hypothetical protein
LRTAGAKISEETARAVRARLDALIAI